MKRILFALCFLISLPSFAQKSDYAYSYTIRIGGIHDTTLMLGHHYGDKQYVIDTVPVNHDGVAVFRGTKPLPGGIYLAVMPSLNNKYFEFIVSGDEPEFTLQTDTSDFAAHMEVKGSMENTVFYKDLNFISAERTQMNALQDAMKNAGNDSLKIRSLRAGMDSINDAVHAERDALTKKYPGLFYTKFLKAVEDIKVPEAPLNTDGTKDSLFAYHYIRQHFFDNIDFSDIRMLRTNLLTTKIDKYLNDYVPKWSVDSIDAGVDFIINKSRANKDIFQFVTVYLLNLYAGSKIMGMDAVYVHIVDTYYKTGQAFWLDDTETYRIINQADRIRPTLIGKQAPPIMLQDSSGKDIPLYSLNSKFIVLLFWDVDCGHCKREMPKIQRVYPEIHALGAEIYAVYTQEEFDKWKKWIRDSSYQWIDVANINKNSDYQYRYDVDQTPLIFVLDPDRKIIAKKVGADQLEGIIEHYNESEEMSKQ